MIDCFFAYSDKDNIVSNSILEAVATINGNDCINITTWDAMDIEGNSIPLKIMKSIDKCDFFLCDITNLNDNVLYELGYSIGKDKPVRLFINKGFKDVEQRNREFDVLTTVGYQFYINSGDLAKYIWKLTEDTEKNTLLSALSQKNIDFSEREFLFMKSIRETEYCSWITREIDRLECEYDTDDPLEVVNQSLEWYMSELIQSNGFIAYLQDDLEGADIRNNKISLVTGIAVGMGLPVLLVAPNNYSSPLDYKSDIVRIGDKKHCEDIIEEWYKNNKNVLKGNMTPSTTHRVLRQMSKLQKIRLGQNVAENEPEELLSYFVETNAFREAQSRNLSLFVGRKGVGKTANLLKLADLLGQSHSRVCVIKPVQYQIDGIIELMRDLTNAEKGFLVESIWKYLIYTELLKTIYHYIQKRPLFAEKSDAENNIVQFVEKNQNVILGEFSERTQNIIQELLPISHEEDEVQEYRIKVSELLHKRIISRVRKLLSDYCSEKEKIVILIDNLDKSWNIGSDIEIISKFLFGLLDVGDNIVTDFSKDSNWNKKINVTLVVFLREDIFSVMKKYAPEADKLQISKMIWDDPVLLLRVIEERMRHNDKEDVWKEYFCKEVSGISTKEYLVKHTLPKPRDLIILVSAALGNAINRNHTIIEENDIHDAEEKYSSFALQTLITELQVEYPDMKNFFWNLLGENRICTLDCIHDSMHKANVPVEKQEELVSMLCQMSFLGLEIKTGIFKYCYDLEQYEKYKVLAEKTSKNNREVMKFCIHPAFYTTLMIEEE